MAFADGINTGTGLNVVSLNFVFRKLTSVTSGTFVALKDVPAFYRFLYAPLNVPAVPGLTAASVGISEPNGGPVIGRQNIIVRRSFASAVVGSFGPNARFFRHIDFPISLQEKFFIARPERARIKHSTFDINFAIFTDNTGASGRTNVDMPFTLLFATNA